MSNYPIVHVEFSASDRKKTAEFYNKVFGWSIQHVDELNYSMFSTGEKEIGGGFNPISDDYPAGTTVVYIGTNDIDATLHTIEAHGGTTLVPKMEIPETGWIAMFRDPTGNMVGLYTAQNPAG